MGTSDSQARAMPTTHLPHAGKPNNLVFLSPRENKLNINIHLLK